MVRGCSAALWFFIGRALVGAELGWLSVLGVLAYGIVVVILLLVPPLTKWTGGAVSHAASQAIFSELAVAGVVRSRSTAGAAA